MDSGVLRLEVCQVKLSEDGAKVCNLVDPYVIIRYRDLDMQTKRNVIKGKKIAVDTEKTKHTFDEQFKINMYDKNDTISLEVREDYFKSKIDKTDHNNATVVGELQLKIEELCKASGNKFWYRL